jgi:choline kinase
MQALILAAGLGSRLQQHTSKSPKALVKVLDKPIIDYQVESLRQCGIFDINIVIGYLGHSIKNHLKKYEGFGCRFSYILNNKYKNTNSAYSFRLAYNLIKNEDYIHLNCDIIFSPKTLKKLLHSTYKDVIALDRSIALADNMEQVRLYGNKIIEMKNTRFEGAQGKAVGLAKLSSNTVAWLKEKIDSYLLKGDITQNYYGIIREAVNIFDIRALPVEELILEINSVHDLHVAEKTLRNDKTFWKL